MPDIKDIATAASYIGNAALGGYAPSAIEIDTKPLQLLAQYTVAYNKAEYDQRQKDAEGRAKELAGIAAIDFSKIDSKWQQPIKEGFDKISELSRTNPNVLSYKDKGYLDYKRMLNEVTQAATNGKANQILLEKRNQDIKNETNVDEKVRRQKILDADVAKTGLNDKLPVEEAYELAFSEPVSPSLLKTSVIKLLPDGNIEKDFSMRDLGKINQQAIAFDMNNPLSAKDITKTDEYIAATPDKQLLMKGEQEAKNNKSKKSGNFAMGQIADQILKNKDYRVGGNPDGEISMQLLLQDPKTTKFAGMIQSFNDQVAEQKAKIIAGEYTDPTGTAIDIKEYYPIDVKNGIDGVELARIQMWVNSAPESAKSKYTNDGNQTKKEIEAMGNKSKAEISAADNRRAITVEGMGNANARYLAGLKGETAKQVTEQGYNPMASIIASIGTVNTSVPISSLSLAQVGAINPNYLDEKGNLDSRKTKDLQISFGTDANGKPAIFELNKDGRGKTKLSETKILSNASSWLATKGKETKGQDAFAYTDDGFSSAMGAINPQKTESTNKTYPLPPEKSSKVIQNGVTYTWNTKTGKYE